MLHKLTALAVCFLSAFALALPAAGAEGDQLLVLCDGCDRAYVNGQYTVIGGAGGIKPFTENGVTYLPLAFLAEASGVDYELNEQENMIRVGSHYLSMKRRTLFEKKDQITEAVMEKRKDTYYLQAEQAAQLFGKHLFYDEAVVILSDSAERPTEAQLDAIKESLYYERPTAEQVIAALTERNPNQEHPRLFGKQADFDAARARIQSDPLVASWYASVKKTADSLLDQPPVRWELRDGIRLLYVSQDVTSRLEALAMTYQIEQDQKYADRAYLEMKAVCEYPVWHNNHWLDIGQMNLAMAVGYDWTYAGMTEAQRTEISDGIVRLGLTPYEESYREFNSGRELSSTNNPVGWWSVQSSNWNPWCNSGVILASLAVGDEHPEMAGSLIENALHSLEIALPAYAPDGGAPEGISYGTAAIGYIIKIVACMDSALGTDFGYFNTPGLAGLAYFIPYMTGTNISFNYSDAGADTRQFYKDAFFVANIMNDPALGNMRRKDIEANRTQGNLYDILWYRPEDYGDAEADMPLDRYFRGVETGSMRSSWDDPSALWLAFHGGDSSENHAHLDSGTFVFDAMGLNWALDLGTETLTYTGTAEQRGDAYLLYRFAPQGHNCLQINLNGERGQVLDSISTVTDFVSQPSGAFAQLDITPAYAHVANSAVRGYGLFDNRTRIVVQDELDLKAKSDVWWLMHTRAEIEVSEDGRSAILTQKGKRLKATVVAPADGATFYAMKAEPLPGTPTNDYQTVNTGVQKLALNVPEVTKTNIRVEFTPVYNDFDLEKECMPYTPLSEWSVPDGEIVLPQLSSISVDGVPIDGFDPSVTNYDIHAEVGDTSVPVVSVESDYRTEIVQPENATDAIAQITVYADDENDIKNHYYLNFSVKPYTGLPTSGTRATISRVTASSEQVDDSNKNYATNAIDGDMDTRWSAEGEQWLLLELDQAYDVNNISIAYYNGNMRANYLELEASTDGKTWTTVYTGESSGMTSDYETYPIVTTRARYIRLRAHGHSLSGYNSGWNSVSEIAVYTPAQAQ